MKRTIIAAAACGAALLAAARERGASTARRIDEILNGGPEYERAIRESRREPLSDFQE